MLQVTLPREYGDMKLSVRLFDPEEYCRKPKVKAQRINDKSDNELLNSFLWLKLYHVITS